MTRSILSLTVAAIACATVPSAISAAPTRTDEPVRQVRVDHADLNLASPIGRQALDRRVAVAVKSVCGSDVYDLSQMLAIRKCRRDALAGAQPQVAYVVRKDQTLLAARTAAPRIETASLAPAR